MEKKSFKMLKNQHISHSIYLLEWMQATTIQKICSATSDFSLSLLLFLRRYLYNEFSCLTTNHVPKYCVNENAGYGLFQRAVSAAIHSIRVFLCDSQLSQLCLSYTRGVCTDRLSWSKWNHAVRRQHHKISVYLWRLDSGQHQTKESH